MSEKDGQPFSSAKDFCLQCPGFLDGSVETGPTGLSKPIVPLFTPVYRPPQGQQQLPKRTKPALRFPEASRLN